MNSDKVKLDPNTIQAVKIEAAKDGVTMKQWITTLVNAEISRRNKELTISKG